MGASSAKPTACLGFLTVVENRELGLLGGYLLLNAAGRPIEFHCTAPVRATRTQEILFGPTLQPFLYGEQIGLTLLGKLKAAPLATFTDNDHVLAARPHCETRLLRVAEGEQPGVSIALGASHAVPAKDYADDATMVRAAWPAEADHLDLNEPFARIREALEEAHRAAAKAA